MECYSGGGDDFRGESGPLKVHRSIPKDPLSLAFINAGKEAGYKETDDISGFFAKKVLVYLIGQYSTVNDGAHQRVTLIRYVIEKI